MYIIAGLGNPGRKYVNSRHNVGFDTLDAVAAKYKIDIKKAKFNGLYGEGVIEGERVVLVKPQTFMNLSGECIRDFKNWYKVDNEQIIIIYDDISLPLGKMRIRPKGSAGGHNGIKSIIYQTGSEVFPRIKIGVGAPDNPDYDLADYVLGHFSKKEIEVLVPVAVKAAEAVGEIIRNGTEKAMSKYNG
ncbi:MAG: aminoacyl-tRNA hydrolase [Clostridia bacterium]|nr:aminoacyl-tRNA hydrolase [Clostridia bacterium]